MKSGLKYMGHILCLFVFFFFSQFEVEKLILEILNLQRGSRVVSKGLSKAQNMHALVPRTCQRS